MYSPLLGSAFDIPTSFSEILSILGLICQILSKLTRIEHLPNGLALSGHISRLEYRYSHTATEFMNDYPKKLNLSVEKSLENKNILVIDDVITDGKTLQTICEKIKSKYPNCHLFAATCCVFANKPNVSPSTIKKFQR
jgi:phosphoribosylpyrophosphate synthetase